MRQPNHKEFSVRRSSRVFSLIRPPPPLYYILLLPLLPLLPRRRRPRQQGTAQGSESLRRCLIIVSYPIASSCIGLCGQAKGLSAVLDAEVNVWEEEKFCCSCLLG